MKQINLSDLFSVAVCKHGSQVEVAKKCGITQSMVSLYVSGKVRAVKVCNIHKIARCLGVNPSVLMRACEKSVQSRNDLSI